MVSPGAASPGPLVLGLTCLCGLLAHAPLARAQALTCGQVVDTTIGAAQEIDVYTFAAEAGDIVTFTFLKTGEVDALFAPLGELFTPTAAPSGQLFSSQQNIPLTQTGTYTLRIRDNAFTRRGSYALKIEWLLPFNKRCTGNTPLTCGRIVNDSISALYEKDVFTFNAEQGDTVTFTFVKTADTDVGFAPLGEIYRQGGSPNGQLFSALQQIPIVETGVYTVRFRDNAHVRRGAYAFKIEWLFPAVKRCSDERPIACGHVVKGDLTAAYDKDILTFAGQLGDTVTITFTTTSRLDPLFAPIGELFAPSGAPNGQIFMAQHNVPLTQTGVYTLRIRDNAHLRRGEYRLGLSWLAPVSRQTCDLDGDGLPDWWETQFGLDPRSAAGDDGRAGDPDADGAANLSEYQTGSHPRGFFKRYLAEGATGAFFDTTLALTNAGAASAAALLRSLKHDATSVGHFLQVPPRWRRTVIARTIEGLADATFSTIIESDHPLVVDRTMSWDATGFGCHAETSVESPSTTWYLAEGSTSADFNLFYLLQNLQPASVGATITFLLPNGPPVMKSYTLAPASRTTIYVDQIPELTSTDLSANITATAPIIVERAMYLNRPGQPFGAGHGSAGVTAPSTSWFLAEGATGPFFELFILLANPGSQTATVEARYLTTEGTVYTKAYSLRPSSRTTIWVDRETFGAQGQALANEAVSTTVTSTNGVPIIVERAMWWPDGTIWEEAHNSPGSTVTGPRWALGDGEVGGPRNIETYVLLANTSPFADDVKVTLVYEDGSTAERTFAVGANSRRSIAASLDFPSSVGRRFATLVAAQGATPAELVVERAMYWTAGGVVWAAGCNAVATRLP